MDKMLLTENNATTICCQAGYLPVPLRNVPAESLEQLEIYLVNRGEYLLYSSIETRFAKGDVDRLLNGGVEFVYVSTKDHQTYYQMMEQALDGVVSDSRIKREKKSEILYATSIELSNQLLTAPPEKEDIHRAGRIARATVNMIINDKQAFGSLYDVFNHDFYTASHLVNVCTLAVSTASKLGINNESELHGIGIGGLLHDFGKIFVPAEILNLTGRLSSSQFQMMQKHVELGVQHIKTLPDISPDIIRIIAEHHERLDGSGYPEGLKHDDISPLGRLAAIVDSFDAMTSVRPYRQHRTYTVEEALQMLEDGTPDKYDREMVYAFNRMIETSLNKSAADGDNRVSLDTRKAAKSKHLQYYFRIPISLKRIVKREGKIAFCQAEQAIAHKLSCIGIGWLSDRPYELDQNVIVISEKFEEIDMKNLVAVVTNCRYQPGGWYLVEGNFHRELKPEHVCKIKTITAAREQSPLAVK